VSKRDWILLFEDILESIDKIENYTKELSFDDFAVNTLVIDGVVRNIEVIGEASKNIPLEIQEQFSDIPWKKLRGIRNRIIHEYFKVDITIIWFIVKNELTPLREALIKHLSEK
jgi:uncharacterized protein with HEPN domain